MVKNKINKSRRREVSAIGKEVDPHGTLAALRKMPSVPGIAGQLILKQPVLGLYYYVLPNTKSRQKVAVNIRGYTGKDYHDPKKVFHVEVTLPGRKAHELLPAACIKLDR